MKVDYKQTTVFNVEFTVGEFTKIITALDYFIPYVEKNVPQYKDVEKLTKMKNDMYAKYREAVERK